MRELDRSGTLATVGAFPDQLRHAAAIAQTVELPEVFPKNVVIAGMGGSGISGELLRDWAYDKVEVPIGVVNDYQLPAYCNESTLVFVESYSGNTEETLSCYVDAMARGCPTVAITSGGELARRAREGPATLVEIPDDLPMPRMATAYLLVPLLVGFEQAGLAYSTDELREAHSVLGQVQRTLAPETPTDQNPAKQIARTLEGTIPVVYGQGILRSAARRWRCNLNENPKMLARDDVFPECNHNDTPAWGGSGNTDLFSVVLLRDSQEPVEVADRVDLTNQMAFSKAMALVEVQAQGEGALARILSSMYVGDYASLYISFMKGEDPAPVDMIEDLKDALKERRENRT